MEQKGVTKHKHKIVTVNWVDSNMTNGWTQAFVPCDMNCESTGYLIEKRKDRIVLAMSLTNHGSIGQILEIPNVAITKIRTIKS